jgi:hypothetical protein
MESCQNTDTTWLAQKAKRKKNNHKINSNYQELIWDLWTSWVNYLTYHWGR